VLVYAVLDIPNFSAAHWTYLVDGRFNFHRISEQKNLSARCAPAHQTVLTLEVSCREDEPMWRWQPEQFRELVLQDLAFFKVDPKRIVKLYVSRLEDAYPIYPIDFEKELHTILQELAGVPNLITTGRQGLFLDIDMHDAMVLGKSAVDALLDGAVIPFYATNSNRIKSKA
jgi:protoporphyrinogen oxidase